VTAIDIQGTTIAYCEHIALEGRARIRQATRRFRHPA
jgi:hypothetical protein